LFRLGIRGPIFGGCKYKNMFGINTILGWSTCDTIHLMQTRVESLFERAAKNENN